jgi:hypothetical protein
MDSIDNKIKDRIKQIIDIEKKIIESNKKIENGDVNPLFLALFGKKLTLQTKIGQSLQTTLGMSFNEQLCEIIAENYGYEIQRQYKLKGFISIKVRNYLDKLLENNSYQPNRNKEIKTLRNKVVKAPKNKITTIPDSTVDLFIRDINSGKEYYIDITSSKPNKKEIRAMKRKLLTWTALRWSQDLSVDVDAYLAVTYSLEKGLGGDKYMHRNLLDRADILVGDELFGLLSKHEYSVARIETLLADIGKDFQKELNTSKIFLALK